MKNIIILIAIYIILHHYDLNDVSGVWGNQGIVPVQLDSNTWVLPTDCLNNTSYPDSVRAYLGTLEQREINDTLFNHGVK